MLIKLFCLWNISDLMEHMPAGYTCTTTHKTLFYIISIARVLQVITLNRRKQQQKICFCYHVSAIKKKKKELKILLSTAQNNKTLYSFVGAWCWPFQTFRMPRMVRNTQVVRLHASVLSLKEIKPSNEARYVFRIHIQQATHNQLESFTITEKNTNTKKELAWNRRRSFPSAPSTLENTTIFVDWHLFQAYQAWTKNICSAKAVSFAQQRPKALTRLFFLTRSWPWLSWLGRPSSHCWDSAGCWEKK